MFNKFEHVLRNLSYTVNEKNESVNFTIRLCNGYRFHKGEIIKKFKTYQDASYALEKVVRI
jgi:hypothetical protein